MYRKCYNIILERLAQASYAALAVVTRDILVIEMWAGQLACEGLNWIIKRVVREERPVGTMV